MEWNNSPFQEHFSEISKQLNRQAFWKTALFGVMLLERQWPAYEKLCVGRAWDGAKEVRQVLDRLWKGVPTGVRLDDKYLLMLEENMVAPLEQPWDAVAACMVSDALTLIHTFRRKDKKASAGMAEQNLYCLNLFLHACGEAVDHKHLLIKAELTFQRELCQRLCQAPNKEKAAFIAQCREEKTESILGSCWFPDYPDYKPLKRKAKKLPVLRYTHVRYDEYVEAVNQTDGQGRTVWQCEQETMKAYDTWLNWSHKMPNDCDMDDPVIQHAVRRWPMPDSLADFYNYLGLSIKLAARSCWACTQDAEQVRGLFWLSAWAQEACYTLLEKGWPCSEYLSHENSLRKHLPNTAFLAIAAGDWALAERILKRWENPLRIKAVPALWREIPATRIWLALLQGDDEKAYRLIEKEGQKKRPPTEEERLWPHLYPWNRWEEDCKIFRMFLEKDEKALEKIIISEIRFLRKSWEQLGGVTLSEYGLALWKLANRRGMELKLPSVSELPAALLEDKPLDGARWRLPGQAVLENALGAQGMELLAEWTQLAKG